MRERLGVYSAVMVEAEILEPEFEVSGTVSFGDEELDMTCDISIGDIMEVSATGEDRIFATFNEKVFVYMAAITADELVDKYDAYWNTLEEEDNCHGPY